MLESVVRWLVSLPALMGLLVFGFGVYFAFRRHKKGVLKIKMPLVGELSTETLSVALIAMALPFLVIAQNVFVKDRELAASEERARQATSFLTYARLVKPEERGPLLAAIAKVMRTEITQVGASSGAKSIEARGHIESMARLMLDVEPGNGHGLYFLGESHRIGGAKDGRIRFRGLFRQFVSVACERSKESFTNRSGAEMCYRYGDGFCAERVAWVLHLLANDYLQDALTEDDAARKKAKLQTAFSDATQVMRIWGQPFAETSARNIATTSVVEKAKAGLGGLVPDPKPPCAQ